MKKIFSLILTVVMALSMATVVFAEAEKEFNTEGTEVNLDVKYNKTAPKMDGKIATGEYYELTFADYKQYFNLLKGEQITESFEDIANYLKNDMKVYMTWNGNDFYVALQGKAPKSEYNCEFSGNEIYIFRAWSFQVAITSIEAENQDRAEVGIAYDPASGGNMISYTMWGTRKNIKLKAGENYAADWNKDEEVVTYEMKLDLSSILGGKAQNDSLFRFGFCLNRGDGDIATDHRQRQIELGGGIGLSKQVENLAVIALTGKSASDGDVDVDVPVETAPLEEEQAGFDAADRFDVAGAAELFDITNGSLEAKDMDENGEKFVRLTVTGENPIIGSKQLTQGLNMDAQGLFVAIKYRSSSEKKNTMALNFTNSLRPTLNRDDDCDSYLGLKFDGEWHTMVFGEMTDYDGWSQFISEFYLCPFFGGEDLIGETIDIQWIKYYSESPVFEDEDYESIRGNDGETSPVVNDGETSPVVTDKAPAEDTAEADTAATETKDDTTKSDVTKADTKTNTDGESGFPVGAIIGIVAAVVVVAAAVVIIIMKKKKA